MLARLALSCVVASALLVPSGTGSAAAATPEPPTNTTKPIGRAQPKGPDAAFDRHAVLVRFRASASAAARDRALRTRSAKAAGAIAGGSFVKVQSPAAAEDLLRSLHRDPAVETASLDYRRQIAAVPNDPAYGQQPYLGTVRLPQAWDLVKDASKEIIAVVDTGVDVGHPDLAGRTVAGYNAVTMGTSVTDEVGHGTMVAGVAAANTNNGVGVAGAAWTGRIMPVKVFRSDGSAYDSDITRGITWAADHGARVINLSLGGSADSVPLHDAIKYATSKGILVVAAAGNTSDNTPQYPAAYAEVLAVGATDKAGTLTDFSSWGSWLDVAAPGFAIRSTSPGGSYAVEAGTSFAAPLVAGVAALVRTRYPSYTPAQVIARLKATARDVGPRGIDPYYGYGLIDAFSAVGGAGTTDLPQLAPGAGEPDDVPDRATELATSLTATMAAEGDVDWYRYDAEVAKGVDLRVTPAPENFDVAQNFDPVVAVYDENLRLVGQADRGGWGDAETLGLTVAKGRSYIAVRNYNGAPDTRPYTISISARQGTLFAPAALTTVGSRPEAVAAGDVTGDGRQDVVLATTKGSTGENDYKLMVYAQQPDGSLAPPVAYTTQLQYGDVARAGVALLDADGDGRTDVALAMAAGVQIFAQTGAGVLEDRGIVSGSVPARGVVASDMDSDGDADLVTTGNDGISLLTQQADHTYVRSLVTTDTSAEVEVGDIDGDGRPDIVGFAAATVRAYHSAPGGWTRTEHVTAGDNPWPVAGIEVADVDSDGRADVVATNGVGGISARLNIFRQSADGGLSAAAERPTTPNPVPIEAGDVNGDGRTDLITASSSITEKAGLLLQTSDGQLSTPLTSDIPNSMFYQPQSLAVGDVDGDGRSDAVIAGVSSGQLVVLRSSPRRGAQHWIRSAVPADFAGDVATTAVPSVTFQRELDPASVSGETIRLVNGRTEATVASTVTYDAATRTVSVEPASLPDNTPYRIVVGAVRDLTGAVHPESSTTFATVDPAPPAITNLAATGAYGRATLSWSLPGVPDLSHVVVRMSTGSAPTSPTSGIAVYTGTATSAVATGLSATSYYVRAWVRDRSGKLSPPADLRLVGTSISTAISPSTLTYGGTVKLTGRLLRSDTGAAMPGTAVQLYARQANTTTWRLLATLTTNSTGTATYSHKPVAGYTYQWGYNGGARALLGSRGAHATVAVRQLVTAYVSKSYFPLGGSVRIYGGVGPLHAGQIVYLQRYVGGRWVSVATSRLSTTSTYSFTVKPSARGTYTYRVVRPADVDHLAGISPMRTFKVT